MDDDRPSVEPDDAPTAGPELPPMTWRDRMELLGADDLPRPLRIAGTVLAAAGLVAGGWLLVRDPGGSPEASLPRVGDPSVSTSVPATAEVVVQAAGAVSKPGLYRLGDGARVADLVTAAGGATPDADLDRVNLAARVLDGTQVRVPRVGEVLVAPSGAGTGAPSPTGPLDLNTATVDQLDELPGIGPATAAAIVAERAERGRFRSVDELEQVRGIGPAKLEQIRDLVRV